VELPFSTCSPSQSVGHVLAASCLLKALSRELSARLKTGGRRIDAVPDHDNTCLTGK
jgi:hypothetical protein